MSVSMATELTNPETSGVAKPGTGRVIVAPISENVDEAMRLLDWYSANISAPGDRLVLVRLLIPDYAPTTSVTSRKLTTTTTSSVYHGGGSASSSAASTSSSEDSSPVSATGQLVDDISIEAQMERQLEASVKQEVRLVRRLRERGKSNGGPRSFRFIHAFGSEFTDSVLSIAAEQGACAVLAPLSAFAADHDLARTYHLYKKARIGVIHAPDW